VLSWKEWPRTARSKRYASLTLPHSLWASSGMPKSTRTPTLPIGPSSGHLERRYVKATVLGADRVRRFRLATGNSPLGKRLRNAWIEGLHQLSPKRLPWRDLREPFRDILDYFGPDGRGALIIEGLSEDDRRRIAGEIFDLYLGAARRISGAERRT
jgi:hypothetical protein